ncbi:MAG: hypothetical protein HN675_11240 [Opitutae bacterium]|jgi:hypothetical protein|nr:hypothetical protein [Opitutae bacterium]MBT7853886.1 hypothetical protein [Opitutae bacterium]
MKRLLILALVSLGGCSTYEDLTEEYRKSWDNGDITSALGHLQKAGERIDEKHPERLLWNLEMVTVARVNQEKSLSNFHLRNSINYIDQKFGSGLRKAKDKKISEYTGYFFDRNMAEIYNALAALEEQDISKASQSLTELGFKRQEAVSNHQKELDDAVREAREKDNHKGTGLNYKMFRGNPSIQAKINSLYDSSIAQKYGAFVNPFGDYIRLIVSNRTDLLSDTSLTNNLLMAEGIGSTQFLQNEIPNDPRNVTYIFLENGTCAKRIEEKFTIPISAILGRELGGVDYVPFAFPKLEPRNDYERSGHISSSNDQFPLEELVSLDAVITAEFKERLGAELARAFLQTVISIGIQIGADQLMERDQQGNKTMSVRNVLLQVGKAASTAIADADIRSWYSLPASVLVCRMNTPPDGSMSLRMDSGQSFNIRVDPQSKTNLVYLKSIRNGGLITEISNFSLGTQGGTIPIQPTSSTITSTPGKVPLEVSNPQPVPSFFPTPETLQPTTIPLPSPNPRDDEYRTWTNNRGQTVEAAIYKLLPNSIHVLKRDHKIYHIPLSELSTNDLNYLKKPTVTPTQSVSKSVDEEYRIWTNKRGQTIEAVIYKVLPDSIHVLKRDHKIYHIPFSELTPNDLNYVKKIN